MTIRERDGGRVTMRERETMSVRVTESHIDKERESNL